MIGNMQYHKPQNIPGLNSLLSELGTNAQIIAGGTDLLVESRYKEQKLSDQWIDISGIAELKKIREKDNRISIGSMVSHEEIVRSDLIRKYVPLLADACRAIGSMQIRNRGTIGGNVCNASPCADSIPALMALDARLVIDSIAGEQVLPIPEFFLKPYQTVLKTGNWLKEIHIKKMDSNECFAFLKLGRRNAVAIARMSFAVIMRIKNDEIIEDTRFVPGSVFPVWRRVTEVEEFLKGKPATRELFNQAGKIASETMIQNSGRRWSTPYKEPVVAALTSRVLSKAAGLE